MMMDGDEVPVVKIHNGKGIDSIPLRLLESCKEEVLKQYGRTLPQLQQRGLTVMEAYILLANQTTTYRNLIKRLSTADVSEQSGTLDELVKYLSSDELQPKYVATIPEADLNYHQAEELTILSSYIATPELRWAVPEGAHTPEQVRLQQKWVAMTAGGGFSEVWRDVKQVTVK